jgi:hypothetical protein
MRENADSGSSGLKNPSQHNGLLSPANAQNGENSLRRPLFWLSPKRNMAQDSMRTYR